ncbi:MAG: TldD/PmbA family protein [Promethearchaeota archaeon]
MSGNNNIDNEGKKDNYDVFENLVEKFNSIIEFMANNLNSVLAQSKIKHWELFGGCDGSTSYNFELGVPKLLESRTSSVITLRVFGEKGKTGSFTLRYLNKDFGLKAIDNAVKIMKVSIENPDFKDLSHPAQKYPPIKTPYDKEIQNLDIYQINDIANEFIKQKERDARIKAISGGIHYAHSYSRVINSNAIDKKDKGTSAGLSVEFTMEDTNKGQKVNSSGFDWQSYNYFKELKKDAELIFDQAFTKAKNGLKKETILTGHYPVIFTPIASSMFISDPLISAIDGIKVYEKRSFLKDALNKMIANENLSILDDPWLENGYATTGFDVEGTPTKPLRIVDKGTLKSYMHNTFSANLFNTQSTGHATRSPSSPTISISPSNVIIEPGDHKYEELIEGIKEGILIDMTYDSPNIVTGEFSGMITEGQIIKNGELSSAMRETLFGIRFLDFYKNIEAIGKRLFRKDSDYMPYIKISDMVISGSK